MTAIFIINPTHFTHLAIVNNISYPCAEKNEIWKSQKQLPGKTQKYVNND